ncbi:hypothetical protein [Desulfofundulus sp.]|uniref:hypothetical protein n=1 Tax=Desulfofundulus sp. TaxID=2282750 RepID=UPI003C743859
MIKAKDMNRAQITHTFCNWCKYRRCVLGYDYWECGLEEAKKEKECLYRQAVRREEGQ